jgi:glyoxylase-like metal-dependent hydrolase (beta-lactamase superfamily II)
VTSAPLIRTLPVGPLQCNCSIVADTNAGEAVVIDPGDEAERIVSALEKTGCRALALLHTHGHFDHIGATAGVKRATGAAIRIHPGDRWLYDSLPEQASFFGLSAEPPLPPDAGLSDGETIAVGRLRLHVLHTPGHTPGSTCFRLEGETPVLFSGDTLFRRSIGRTDFRGGDTKAILSSIREKLFTLPPDLKVVCGHGPDTTVAEERRENPFVTA